MPIIIFFLQVGDPTTELEFIIDKLDAVKDSLLCGYGNPNANEFDSGAPGVSGLGYIVWEIMKDMKEINRNLCGKTAK